MKPNITRRSPRRAKPSFARAIIKSPDLSIEQKSLALYLLKISDENGVIRDPEINDAIHEALTVQDLEPEEPWYGAADGRR